jgi:8-amino-7-oxononanoate synthase
MEGDIAPLADICTLCERHGARLMVDEAHGVGVLGERGAGAAELLGVEDRVDLRMGTFSKSLASCGGFVAGPAEVIEYLRIYSRQYLFSAAGVPAALGAALAALRVARSEEGRERFARLLENAWLLHDGLASLGYAVVPPQPLPSPPPSPSPPGVRLDDSGGATIVTPIVPILVGDDWKAGVLWRALYDAGVFVNTAVHPAVGPGEALLRTSVMASHETATIEQAVDIFARVKSRFESEHGALPSTAPRP